jgi:hypothetical protein
MNKIKGGFETMNKNLKRVISAVSALAVTASGAAAFAISYPDVPETADYNQAVTELSALGVVNGFEDGTFRPDENVTRAQITKMVVTALGNTAVSQAEASTGRDTQFQDVPGSHWASGFVAVGTSSTASNFINGYSATTFGPEDNVTYAQAVKMVVAALGYTTLAEGQGGWPSGYLKYGYQLGIATLTGVGNDDQLNRAQVSVIIDNALKCPICVANGYTYDALGRQIPNTLIKDGTGDLDDTKDGYQNLLNYAHDAYLVYGRVTGTFRSGANVDPDEIRFNVEKADNWDGYSINSAKNSDAENIKAYKGQVLDADDYLFTYSEAIIQKDKNDEYTMISMTKYGASEIVTLQASDFKKITAGNNDYQVQMYKDAGHSKYDTYKLNTDAETYVNGREYPSNLVAFFEGEYVDGNQVGSVTLIDSTEEGKSSTDGKYDYVMVSFFVDGVVDDLDEKTDEVTINLDVYDTRISNGKVVLDLDDDDKDFNITLNGEIIAPTDLQQDDVVSIAYDVTGSFKDSDTYDIFVSRDTVEGKVNSVYTDPDNNVLDNEYTLDNGEIYKLAYDGDARPESGYSYTLYLDAFGKIAKVEELASSKKYALLENVYKTNGDADAYVDIVTGTGDKVSYQIKTDDFDAFVAILMGENTDLFDTSAKISNRVVPEERVISFKLTQKGELRLDSVEEGTSFNGEYKSGTQKLDGKQLSESLSQIVDISDYDADKSQSYSSVGLSDFTTGTTYKGFAFGRTGSDRTYQYVLITEGIGGFNVDNNWAVFVQQTNVDTDNGDSDAVTAYVGGELRTIPVESVSDIEGLAAGDIFFYKLNSDNEIEEVRMVTPDSMLNTSYQAFSQFAIGKGYDILDSTTSAQFAAEEGNNIFAKSDNKDDCELIAGPIVNVTNGDIAIVTPAELAKSSQDIEAVTIDNVKTYELASDANVYVYDYSVSKAKDRITTAGKSSVRKSSFARDAYVGEKRDDIVNFVQQLDIEKSESTNANYGQVNFAIAKVVDKDITEILVVIPDEDED